MKFEVTINTVNSASWMIRVGHCGFTARTDKATFNIFVPDEYTRDEALSQLSNFIHDFNLFTPDMGVDGTDVVQAVCSSFDDAADELLKLDISKPVNYYRSCTYGDTRTAVIAVKEI